jgi:hypothetical protein
MTDREAWRKAIEGEGAHCPTCDRWGRIYGRSINRTMANSIMWLSVAVADEDGWVDIPSKAPRWLVRSNQLPTLKWWGLVERRYNDKNSKNKHSGMWRITDLGRAFVHGQVSIPKKVFTYNDIVQSVSPENIFIKDCFKLYFDYRDLMNSYYPNKIL